MRRTLGLSLIIALVMALVPAVGASAATVSTTTVLEAPNQFGSGSNMPIRVQVTADSGAAAPTGNVTIYNSFGAYVDSYTLTPTNNGGYSWAEFIWSSGTLGRNGLKAVFSPNTNDFAPSASTFAGIQILRETPLTALQMPDRFVVGTQANLTLIVTPGSGGGAATLNVNNVQVHPSTPNRAGEVEFQWTPTQEINYTFLINYSNSAGNAAESLRQAIHAFAS
jgi:hypothetical protein